MQGGPGESKFKEEELLPLLPTVVDTARTSSDPPGFNRRIHGDPNEWRADLGISKGELVTDWHRGDRAQDCRPIAKLAGGKYTVKDCLDFEKGIPFDRPKPTASCWAFGSEDGRSEGASKHNW